MDYKEKYEQALERAREIIKDYENRGLKDILFYAKEDFEAIFPELKESKEPEDERIRKEIISALKNANYKGVYDKHLAWLEKQGEQKTQVHFPKFTFEDVLALECSMKTAKITKDGDKLYEILVPLYNKIHNAYLLEKQGEQNTADKVEPKFHNGDWVTDGYLHCKISDVLDDRYIVDTKFAKRSAITFKRENNYHLWTIQDAKDGDVLVNGSNIFIFHFIKATRLMGYCHVNTDDGRFYDDIGKNECFCLIDAVVTPATNAQRDILFQKMKEAGYEWDAEKKELKIIDWSKHVKYEPNSPSIIEENTEWGEEDVRNIENIDTVLFYDKDLPEDTCMRLRNWLKSLKQRMKGE